MATAAGRCSLTVQGHIWEGWTRVTVTRGIGQTAGTFSLELVDCWAGGERRPIAPGDACTVALDGQVAITGFVDDDDEGLDGTTHRLGVTGRDRTADLVDCSVLPPWEFEGLTIDLLCAALAAPFAVPVWPRAPVGRPFESFAVQPGETVFAAIERACRQRQVLPMADGKGGLLLVRAGSGPLAPAALVTGRQGAGQGGVGITHVARRRSNKDRFSSYVFLGQEGEREEYTPAMAAEGYAAVADPGIRRNRPLIVQNEAAAGGDGLAQRAAWEARVRAARSRSVEVTVVGWTAAGSGAGAQLWQPNSLVDCQLPWTDLPKRLLIGSVAHELSEQGTTTRLELFDPAGFEMEPVFDGDQVAVAIDPQPEPAL